jgi:hypothetical protein
MSTIYRTDLNQFAAGMSASTLVDLIVGKLPIDSLLFPNDLGNLAVIRIGPSSAPDMTTRWYCGFIDLVTGEVVIERDPDTESVEEMKTKTLSPRMQINSPYQGQYLQVDGLAT